LRPSFGGHCLLVLVAVPFPSRNGYKLLLIILTMNTLGGLLLLPALIAILNRSLSRQKTDDQWRAEAKSLGLFYRHRVFTVEGWVKNQKRNGRLPGRTNKVVHGGAGDINDITD